MSKRRGGPNGKARRDARRQRDREWVQLKAVSLLMLGASRVVVEHAIKAYTTRGHFQQWMNRTGWGKALKLHDEGKYPA